MVWVKDSASKWEVRKSLREAERWDMLKRYLEED